MPVEQIDDAQPLPQFGVDSMIAAEFRTWFWTTFRVDMPFLDLMGSQKSLVNLAGFVEGSLVESWKQDGCWDLSRCSFHMQARRAIGADRCWG